MTTLVPPIVKVSELFQAGIVVKDAEKSMKLYGHLFGIDSWWVATIDSKLCQLTYRGKPSQHSFKAAMAMVGPLMIELLQPLDGYGTYREFLEKHGEGIHHLGHVIVPDLATVVEKMEKAGFPAVETGEPVGSARGSHKWAYVDTTPALGYVIEYSQGADPRDSMKAYQMHQKKKAAGNV
ncbi:MAG: VOC family protein [Chloroflexi bacterium]|nr:VOC family protein [Chloroflexota bacterium]